MIAQRMIIIEEDDAARTRLSALFKDAGFTVLAEASDPIDGYNLSMQLHPDIVVVDLGMKYDGPALVQSIQTIPNPPKILMLLKYEDEFTILRSLNVGANGYCLARTPSELVSAASKDIAHGASYICPGLSRIILDLMETVESLGMMSPITARETEILGLMAEAKSYDEIAKEMYCSIHEIKREIAVTLTNLAETPETHITQALIHAARVQ